MDIIKYLNKIHQLPQEADELLNSLFKPIQLSKGTKIMCSEKKYHKFMFVEKGLIRLYYEKEEKDITFLFLDENSCSAPIDCIFYNLPNQYNWHVLEDTTVRLIDFYDFENLLINLPILERTLRMILIDIVKMISDKLFALQFQSAEQRYNFMLECYPNILLRAPLGHIASYLGITQQTLSVIRAKI